MMILFLMQCWVVIAFGVNDSMSGVPADPWLFMLVGAGIVMAIWLIILWGRRGRKQAKPETFQPTEIPSYREAFIQFAPELDRARRYGRKLSIVVLGVDNKQTTESKNNGHAQSPPVVTPEYLYSIISSLLRDNLRGSDYVAYDATQNCFVLLLAETSAAVAEQAVSRMQSLVHERASAPLRFGIAEFSSDGLIIQDLVTRAHARYSRMVCDSSPKSTDAAIKSQGTQRKESLAQ